jgi:hypothetical protein
MARIVISLATSATSRERTRKRHQLVTACNNSCQRAGVWIQH